MRVRVRGVEFDSVAECATHFGIGQNAVYKALERDRAMELSRQLMKGAA